MDGHRPSYVTYRQRPSFLWRPSLWWTWLWPMSLQDMAMPMALGPPAMFVFLSGAVMDHVRDGLEWCYSSIFPCQRFYCCDPECQDAVNLCTSYWKSLGHLMIYHSHIQNNIFFFGNCPSLIYNLVSLHHIPWCSLCLQHFHAVYLINLSWGNSSAAFDPTYIFISCWHPQCSTRGRTAGLKPVLWSRAMAGLRMGPRWYFCNLFPFLFKTFYFILMAYAN